MPHMGEDGALSECTSRALALDERPKRLREGWASRSDVWSRPFPLVTNGAGRVDAPERPIRHPLFRYPLLSY
jgi:hypothetical protein